MVNTGASSDKELERRKEIEDGGGDQRAAAGDEQGLCGLGIRRKELEEREIGK